MKKYLLILSIFFLCSFDVPVVPTSINIGEKITSAGTSDVELQFRNVYGSPFQTIYIIVDASNNGTIQFSSGIDVPAANQPYAAGSKIIMTIMNGTYNLHYKASASSQSFSVTQ